MTKWLVTIIILSLLLIPPILAGTDPQPILKAPFAKAKELACEKGEKEPWGMMWVRAVSINGDEVKYILAYNEQTKVVTIAESINPEVRALSYMETECLYVAERFVYGVLVQQDFLPEKESIALAFKLFRELVEQKLI